MVEEKRIRELENENKKLKEENRELREGRNNNEKKKNSVTSQFFLTTATIEGAPLPPSSMRESAFVAQEVKEEVVATAVAKHSYEAQHLSPPLSFNLNK